MVRYKGQSRKAAQLLFGLPKGRLMESPQQRAHMIEILKLSHNPQIKMLVREADASNLIGSLHVRDSFAKLCEQNALTWKAVADEYVAIQKSHGLVAMADRLPAIMEQTAIAAMIRDETCPRCKGVKRVRLKNMKFGSCPKCNGTGTTRVDADPDRLKLVFNTFGLTGQGASANVNVNTQVNIDAAQTMEDLARDVSSIIDGTAKVSE